MKFSECPDLVVADPTVLWNPWQVPLPQQASCFELIPESSIVKHSLLGLPNVRFEFWAKNLSSHLFTGHSERRIWVRLERQFHLESKETIAHLLSSGHMQMLVKNAHRHGRSNGAYEERGQHYPGQKPQNGDWAAQNCLRVSVPIPNRMKQAITDSMFKKNFKCCLWSTRSATPR